MASKQKARDEEITKKATKEEKEFIDSTLQVEGTKAADSVVDAIEDMKAALPEKNIIRGEDVLEILRKKGMKI